MTNSKAVTRGSTAAETTQPRLATLAPELIANIALYCDAKSILQLSRACQKLHAVCYDAHLLKARLELTQRRLWQSGSLDMEAISIRCGSSVHAWARYAVADHCAWQMQQFDVVKGTFGLWLPALATVKHPVCARYSTLSALTYAGYDAHGSITTHAHGFVTVVGAVLSTEGFVENTIAGNMEDLDDLNFLGWLFRLSKWDRIRSEVATELRKSLEDLSAFDLNLRPMKSDYNLPLPFSDFSSTAVGGDAVNGQRPSTHQEDVLDNTPSNGEKTVLGETWGQWYSSHLVAMCQCPNFLSSGVWAGLYDYDFNPSTYGILAAHWDQPMRNIRMRMIPPETCFEALSEHEATWMRLTLATQQILYGIEARSCRDGVGTYSLHGIFYMMGTGQVGFVATKCYIGFNGQREHSWVWNCRLTPFGIFGHWGLPTTRSMELHTVGKIWIWRRSMGDKLEL